MNALSVNSAMQHLRSMELSDVCTVALRNMSGVSVCVTVVVVLVLLVDEVHLFPAVLEGDDF